MPPIKVIHFADVHLGVENYGRLDPHTGLPTRLTDFLRSLDTIVDAAINEKADLVIFSGDAYKTRSPSPTHQREFASRIRRLSQAGLPTVLVTGNHDVNSAVGRASTLEIFRALEVENVYVSDRPMILYIETRSGPVQIITLPWVMRNALLSKDEYKNQSLEEMTALLEQKVEMILGNESLLLAGLEPDIPHILVSHGTVQGASYSSEQNVMFGNDIVLPLSLLKAPHWDYVAMGHLHRHQEIEPGRFPPIVYPGSIERVDFGEEREDKGFIIAEVGRSHCSWEFRKLDARRFCTIRVIADKDDPTAQIIQAIEQSPIEDTIVRVIISTTAARDVLIRESEVRKALKGAFYVAAIVHDVVRPDRMRLGTQQEISSMTFMETLEHYLLVKETLPDRIAILTHHAELLSADN